jgi:hypothetical protein
MRKPIEAAPRELVETTLAHVIADKAEQAYRRSDRRAGEAPHCLQVDDGLAIVTLPYGAPWRRGMRGLTYPLLPPRNFLCAHGHESAKEWAPFEVPKASNGVNFDNRSGYREVCGSDQDGRA